jgi:ABC-type nitrate/sulfonate/bicarbonate transport system permease component
MSGRFVQQRRVSVIGYALAVTVVLILWQYGSSMAIIPLLFPSPLSTWRAAMQLLHDGRLLTDVAVSLRRIALGFLIGSTLGVMLGALMGSFRSFRLVFDPYVQFFRALPALAWIPATMLWLGTGEESKIALLAYTTVFVVALNTMIGVSHVSVNQVRAAKCFGARSWQVFHLVKAPATVPYMLTGMRLGMGNCFSTIVAAELLAPKDGIGYLIFSSRTWMQTEFAFVGIIILGLLGFLVDRTFLVTTKRLLARFVPGRGW